MKALKSFGIPNRIMPKGRPKCREVTISIGVMEKTRRRLDLLGFNLDCSRGNLVDLLVGHVPKIKRKLTKQQRRMLRLRIIRRGRQFKG